MKDCNGCKHAKWQRTASGRLHPSGDGQCEFEVKMPVLPASMNWGYMFHRTTPKPSGGRINRREPLKDHCPCYERGKL